MNTEELSYLDRMKIRLQGNEDMVPFFLGDKAKVREIAKIIGVKTPEIYFKGKLDAIPWDSLPKFFVFKPSYASTSIGIFLIEKKADGTWVNAFNQDPVSKDDIIKKAKEVSARFFDGDEDKGQYIIEELLQDSDGTIPPKDIRVNAFFGELGMIYTDDHFGPVAKSAYFDGDFHPFPDVEDRYGIAEPMQKTQKIVQATRPANADLIVKIAKRISIAIPTAFVRIDLYDTPNGIYLGELTFTPGAFYYKNVKLMHEKEALRLGRIWQAASLRLQESGAIPAKR